MSIDNTRYSCFASAEVAHDLAEIRRHLTRLPFPARQDDMLAALVRQHAPARLLWRAGGLPRTRRYASLDEVLADLAAPQTPGGPPPPGW